MASGGHNAKPSSQLKKDGTYRKDRHAARVEGVAKILEVIPKAPAHFDQKHREKWAQVCKKVYELGILAEQDTDAIEQYVCNWLMWEAAAAEVLKRGITFTDGDRIIKNPAFNVMQEAGKVVNQIGALFGFSPRARMGIKTQETKPEDPFAKFLNN